jgi:hypothetical protein
VSQVWELSSLSLRLFPRVCEFLFEAVFGESSVGIVIAIIAAISESVRVFI